MLQTIDFEIGPGKLPLEQYLDSDLEIPNDFAVSNSKNRDYPWQSVVLHIMGSHAARERGKTSRQDVSSVCVCVLCQICMRYEGCKKKINPWPCGFQRRPTHAIML